MRFATISMGLVAAVFAGCANVAAQSVDAPQRIVSINLCTDQFLMALAHPEQIHGLTFNAPDPTMSFMASTGTVPDTAFLRGTAEEVLRLKPDLVLTSTFTSLDTRDRLQRFGIPVQTVPPVTRITEAITVIGDLGARLGRSEEALRLTNAIERELTLLRQLRPKTEGLSGLQLQRRSVVFGSETLIGDLMAEAGLRNAARRLNVPMVAQVDFETILTAEADFLIITSNEGATDQGAALLSHPALVVQYPPEKRIRLDGLTLLCGGPGLPVALASFREGLEAAIDALD